ncbi:hypothetical protein [Marinitenerispora sediminis]|uniref:hypothetical protein n=1 Tax=Marinitenerispora sediminis TaxID=1931232 RepID=UPI000DF18F73|nr:hypothetical protein [Marinitenerispora sediminis]RCV55091.1 hypothetical protein DEF23_14740 [Marinitenerispora sediminis]
MSDYHDLVFLAALPDTVPDAFLAELRWQLRLTETEPPEHTAVSYRGWGEPFAVFMGDGPSPHFAGHDHSRLLRRSDGGGWLVDVRSEVHEDDYGLVLQVVEWILRHSVTRGRFGRAAYTGDDIVWTLFWDGERVVPLRDGAAAPALPPSGRGSGGGMRAAPHRTRRDGPQRPPRTVQVRGPSGTPEMTLPMAGHLLRPKPAGGRERGSGPDPGAAAARGTDTGPRSAR